MLTKVSHLTQSHSDVVSEPGNPRISGIQIMPRQKVNERGKTAFLTEIILYKRKGGIRLL